MGGMPELKSIDDLAPAPYNPREIDDASAAGLGGSLQKFGDLSGLVWNARSGNLVAGHQRVAQLRALGGRLEDGAVVVGKKRFLVRVVDWDRKTEVAANVAANNPAIQGRFTDQLEPLLGEIMLDLGKDDFELLRFDLLKFDAGPAPADDVKQDQIPDAPKAKDAVTRPGDVWTLGRHRLICGDCRNPKDLARLFADAKADVAITSPPYADRRKYDEDSGFKPIPPEEYVAWFKGVADGVQSVLADTGSWFVNIKEGAEDGERLLYVKDLVLAHKRDWGWRFVDELMWTHGGTPKAVVNRFKNCFEPIFQFTRNGHHKFRPTNVMKASKDIPDWKGLHPNMEDVQQFGTTEGMRRKGVRADGKKSKKGGKLPQQGEDQGGGGHYATVTEGLAYPGNVLSVGKNREALGHSAAFPVALPAFFVRAFSDPGDRIFDPFMGSGTTLIAAEQLDRVAYGTEISRVYCDVIVERIQRFAGIKAKRTRAGK